MKNKTACQWCDSVNLHYDSCMTHDRNFLSSKKEILELMEAARGVVKQMQKFEKNDALNRLADTVAVCGAE